MPPKRKTQEEENEEFQMGLKPFLNGISIFEFRGSIGMFGKDSSKFTEQCITKLISKESKDLQTTLPNRLPTEVNGCYAFVVPAGTDPSADFLAPWCPLKVKKWRSKPLENGTKLFLQQLTHEERNVKRMIAFIGDKNGKQQTASFYMYCLEGEDDDSAREITNSNTTCSSSSGFKLLIPKMEVYDPGYEKHSNEIDTPENESKKSPRKRRSDRSEALETEGINEELAPSSSKRSSASTAVTYRTPPKKSSTRRATRKSEVNNEEPEIGSLGENAWPENEVINEETASSCRKAGSASEVESFRIPTKGKTKKSANRTVSRKSEVNNEDPEIDNMGENCWREHEAINEEMTSSSSTPNSASTADFYRTHTKNTTTRRASRQSQMSNEAPEDDNHCETSCEPTEDEEKQNETEDQAVAEQEGPLRRRSARIKFLESTNYICKNKKKKAAEKEKSAEDFEEDVASSSAETWQADVGRNLQHIFSLCQAEVRQDNLAANEAKRNSTADFESSSQSSAEPSTSTSGFLPVDDSNLVLPADEIKKLRRTLYQSISSESTDTRQFLANCIRKTSFHEDYDEYIFQMNGIKGIFVPPRKDPGLSHFVVDSWKMRDFLNNGEDWLLREMPSHLPSKIPGSYIFLVDKEFFKKSAIANGKHYPQDFLAPWEAKEKDRAHKNRRTTRYDTGAPGADGLSIRNIRCSHYLNEQIKRKISYLCLTNHKPESHYVLEYRIPPIENDDPMDHPNFEEMNPPMEYEDNFEMDVKPNITKLQPKPVQAVAPIQSPPPKGVMAQLLEEFLEESSPRQASSPRKHQKKRLKSDGDNFDQVAKETTGALLQKQIDAALKVPAQFNVQWILVKSKVAQFQQDGRTGLVEQMEIRERQLRKQLEDLAQKWAEDQKKSRAMLEKPYSEIAAAATLSIRIKEEPP